MIVEDPHARLAFPSIYTRSKTRIATTPKFWVELHILVPYFSELIIRLVAS